MAVGDLITADYQFEMNGILIDGGLAAYCSTSPYRLTDPAGLFTRALRTSDVPKPLDDGSYPGHDYLDVRTITFDMQIISNMSSGIAQSDMTAYIDILNLAWQPQTTLVPLVFQTPGNGKRVLFGRPRKLAIDTKYLGLGWCNVKAEFVALDPRFYSLSLNSSGIGLPTSSGGLNWLQGGTGLTWTTGLSWGSSTSGAITINNAGNTNSRPVITLFGPITAPSIENLTANALVGVVTDLALGDTLTFDFNARTILLNGTASRYSDVTTNSVWWELLPGNNTIRLHGSGTGIGTITWRSAWI